MITRARKIRKDCGKAVSSVCERTFVHLKSQERWLPTQNLHKINAAKFPAWTGNIQPCILLYISINVINIAKIIKFLPWSKYSSKCFKILIHILFTVILFLFIYVLSQGVAISPCRLASNLWRSFCFSFLSDRIKDVCHCTQLHKYCVTWAWNDSHFVLDENNG